MDTILNNDTGSTQVRFVHAIEHSLAALEARNKTERELYGWGTYVFVPFAYEPKVAVFVVDTTCAGALRNIGWAAR